VQLLFTVNAFSRTLTEDAERRRPFRQASDICEPGHSSEIRGWSDIAIRNGA
jgi:hypothetical protein